MAGKRLELDVPEDVDLASLRLEVALTMYRGGKVSQGAAAQIAGMTRAEFFKVLAEHELPFTNITEEDLDEEMRQWRR